MIANAAVQEFITCFESASGYALGPLDAEQSIRTIRSRIGNKALSLANQHAAVVASLVLLKRLLLEHADNVRGVWTVNEWTEVFWTLLESSIARTQSTHSVEGVLCSEERWAKAVVEALGETKEAVSHMQPMWWSSKAVVMSLLVLSAMISWQLSSLLVVPAKFKFLGVCFSTACIALSFWFYFRGPGHWYVVSFTEEVVTSELIEVGKHDDSFSLKKDDKETVIVQMKEEMEELKRQLEASATGSNPPMPPPAHAPPLPGQAPQGPPDVSGLDAELKQLEAPNDFQGQPNNRVQERPLKIKVTRASNFSDFGWNLNDSVSLSALDDLPDYEGAIGNISEIGSDGFFQVTLLSGDIVDFLLAGNLAKPKPVASVGCPKQDTASALRDETGEDSNWAAAPLSGQEEALNFNQWHSRLASDFPRAGADIYRKIRSSGAASVRSFVTEFFTMEQRSGPVFQQRFEQASQIDFKVAQCESHSQLMEMLGTDDGVEVSLRSLAAWIHHRRTGDSEASNSMLAVRGPGSGADIAPNWLVTESGIHSKLEYQRLERGKAPKGAGKGKPGKDKDSKTGGEPKGKAKAKKKE
jgi:protein-S-isoprenylcysteine O-methyltransferase Ste14